MAASPWENSGTCVCHSQTNKVKRNAEFWAAFYFCLSEKQQKTPIINYDSRPFLSLFMFLISVRQENIGTSEKDRDIAYNW